MDKGTGVGGELASVVRALPMRGQCLCGHVRLLAKGAPLSVMNCHCSSCRRASGAPFVTMVAFAKKDLELDGHMRVYESSTELSSSFCAHCGSRLWSQNRQRPRELTVPAGLFDRATLLVPTSEIHTSMRLHWVREVVGAEQFAGVPAQEPATAPLPLRAVHCEAERFTGLQTISRFAANLTRWSLRL